MMRVKNVLKSIRKAGELSEITFYTISLESIERNIFYLKEDEFIICVTRSLRRKKKSESIPISYETNDIWFKDGKADFKFLFLEK